MRGGHIWLYDVDNNSWTDCLPESQYDMMTQSSYTTYIAKQGVGITYCEPQQVMFTFAGIRWGVYSNQIHYYDAYTNELVRLDAAYKPTGRDVAGLSYDPVYHKILMFGSQYRSDETTYIYDIATNTWTSYAISPCPPSTVAAGKTYASLPQIRYDSIHNKHIATVWAEGDTGDSRFGSITTWEFDMATLEWTEAATTEPNGTYALVRSRNMSFSPADNMFIFESQHWPSGDAGNLTNELYTYKVSNTGAYHARPQAPTVTTTVSAVTVSWTAMLGATEYNVYRATGSIPNLVFAKIGDTTGASYEDSDVTPETVYYYRYAPVYNSLEGTQSYYGQSRPIVMAAPVVSARTDYTVDIEWTAHTASDIAGYNLYRGLCTVHTNTTMGEMLYFTSGTGQFVNGETVTQGAVSATVKYAVLQSGTWGSDAAGYLNIYYRTGGSFAAGSISGSLSGAATATAAESKIASDSKWNECNYDGYTTNQVHMVRNVTGVTKVNTSLIATTTYHDTGVDLSSPGTESADYPFAVYAYIIRAVNNFGVESGPSPYKITIPSAPTNVLINTTTKTLQWDAAPEDNVVSYDVYQYARTENSGLAPVNKIATGVSSPYTLTGTYASTDRFWVVPVDSLGQDGIPSSPIYYGDFYSGFYSGSLHQ